jgi:hypothetical protein
MPTNKKDLQSRVRTFRVDHPDCRVDFSTHLEDPRPITIEVDWDVRGKMLGIKSPHFLDAIQAKRPIDRRIRGWVRLNAAWYQAQVVAPNISQNGKLDPELLRPRAVDKIVNYQPRQDLTTYKGIMYFFEE